MRSSKAGKAIWNYHQLIFSIQLGSSLFRYANENIDIQLNKFVKT